MSHRCESPENVKRTNPYEYQLYENIKERHYYGKYNPCEKVDSDYPETAAFCECTDQERNDFCADLAAASGAVKKLWGCTKINLGSFGDTNPHLHFHIVPQYEGGFEFGGSFAITNPDPVFLKDEEYKEMIAALQKELGI